MRKLFFTTVMVIMCMLLLISCSNNSKIEQNVIFNYTGTLKSVIKQNGLLKTEIEEEYYVSVHGFYPEGELFEEYNRMYLGSDNEYRVISITSNTRIYTKEDNKKILLSVEELETMKETSIEFWIFPYGEVLEAMEIVVVD